MNKTGYTVAVLGFGLGGHHEEYSNVTATLSGYDSPENWTPDEGVNYEGCIVIDKREVVTARPSLAYRSPILAATITETDPFPRNLCASPMAQAVGSQNGTIAACNAMQQATPEAEPGPFDRVPVPIYRQWWENNGARTGQVIAGRIVWSDGTTQPRKLWPAEMAAQIGIEVTTESKWFGQNHTLTKDGKTIATITGDFYGQKLRAELINQGAPEFI
jgi:hypothetical protein